MASYQIQNQQQGEWVTTTTLEDKDEALATAKRLFGNKACTGMRVITVNEQTHVETELYIETRTVKAGAFIRTSQIDWAPEPCTELDQYYASTSRRLMGRVLRDYFDKMIVTPTEVLYNIKEASRLQDQNGLIQGAVDKVAALQGGADKVLIKTRNEEMTKAVDAMVARVRKADRLAIPKVAKTLSETIIEVQKIETQGENIPYVTMVALAKELSSVRNWLGKLHRLCKLADADKDHPQALSIIDGVIADCLAGAVVQDILGYQANLASALLAMIDMAEGKFVPEKSDAGDAALIITTLCGLGKLPETRQSIIERVHRQVSGSNALNRIDPNKDKDEFKRLLERLVRPNGLYSGPATAEALTQRYGRLIEKGGAAGRRAAFVGVFFLIPDRTGSIHYLCELTKTNMAEDCAQDIEDKTANILNIRNFMDLSRAGLTVKERLQRLTFALKSIAASELPEAAKNNLTLHLNHLLDRFITEGQILEKMDAPTNSVKDRAMIMAQFCTSGILPPGKTMQRFREHLQALTKSADFEPSFIAAHPTPEQGQKALTILKQLLTKSGLS